MNARPCSRALRPSGGRSRPSLHLYMLVVAPIALLRGQKGRSAAPTQQVPREPGEARFCGPAAVQALDECRCSAREAMQPRPASRRRHRRRAAAGLTHSTRSPPLLTLPPRLQEPWTSALDSSAPARWQRRWPAPSSHRACAALSRSSPPTCELGRLALVAAHLWSCGAAFGLLAADSRAAAAAQQCSSERGAAASRQLSTAEHLLCAAPFSFTAVRRARVGHPPASGCLTSTFSMHRFHDCLACTGCRVGERKEVFRSFSTKPVDSNAEVGRAGAPGWIERRGGWERVCGLDGVPPPPPSVGCTSSLCLAALLYAPTELPSNKNQSSRACPPWQVVKSADVIFIAVKPQYVSVVLREVRRRSCEAAARNSKLHPCCWRVGPVLHCQQASLMPRSAGGVTHFKGCWMRARFSPTTETNKSPSLPPSPSRCGLIWRTGTLWCPSQRV